MLTSRQTWVGAVVANKDDPIGQITRLHKVCGEKTSRKRAKCQVEDGVKERLNSRLNEGIKDAYSANMTRPVHKVSAFRNF